MRRFATIASVPNLLPELREKYGWDFPGQQPLPDEEVTIAELLKAQRLRDRRHRQMGPGHGRHQRRPEPARIRFVLRLPVPGACAQSLPEVSCGGTTRRNRCPATTATATGETYSQDKFTEEAVKFIREHKDGPFFLYLPFTIPHLVDPSAGVVAGRIRGQDSRSAVQTHVDRATFATRDAACRVRRHDLAHGRGGRHRSST